MEKEKCVHVFKCVLVFECLYESSIGPCIVSLGSLVSVWPGLWTNAVCSVFRVVGVFRSLDDVCL